MLQYNGIIIFIYKMTEMVSVIDIGDKDDS